MAKINISLPDEFLKELDELTKRTAKSRSELIRDGVRRIQEDLKQKKEQEALRMQRQMAIQKMEAYRERYGKKAVGWDSTKEIREWRDRDRLTRQREREGLF